MIYITGDKHRRFYDVYKFCLKNKTTKDDVLIVLGDAGINYYASKMDSFLKKNILLLYFVFTGIMKKDLKI